MRRRDVLMLLSAVALGTPGRTFAETIEKLPKIGVLVAESPPHPFPEAFKSGLRDLGYVVGQNIAIEWRYADGQYSRAVEIATELVRLGVDIIVAHHTPAVRAAKNATRTIPIVMAPAGAPLQTGLVENLARPGGNVTGLSAMEAELGGKRLDLLREIIPHLERVAVLGSITDPFTEPFVKDMQAAGARNGIRIQPVLVSGLDEFENAFAAMAQAKAQAVMVQPLFSPYAQVILELGAKHRLPIMTSYREITQAGGMISFSADHSGYFRRTAVFVDRILKGANPADLPVEQPTKFELTINGRAAHDLGLTIPPALLARADEVIE
jgi:putative ABC transport system substrate-binding protein